MGVKISALPAIVTPAYTDIFPVVQGGITYKESGTQFSTLFLPLTGGTMSGPLLVAGNPTTANQVANKAYVDLIAQGITIQGACRLGTTTALTATYANGSAGVGATLTNAGAMAALTLDGVAAAVNDRILVKDQASTLQNGIYTVTAIGSGAANWVLTRATDYDLVAQINPGDLVIITAGTTLTNTSWIETAIVTAIGTDAIVFVQFSGAGFVKVVVQTFVANGTYTPTANMKYCIVEAVGGGGGGGGTGASGGAQICVAGGGGGGSYSRSRLTAAQIGVSQAVTIGAAGTAGDNTGGTGGTGGATTLGALVTTNGGLGGVGTTTAATNVASGGLGGGVGTADIAIPGSSGGVGYGAGIVGFSGFGGASHLSGSNLGVIINGGTSSGGTGLIYGGGGAGAGNANAAGAAAGGAGAAGFMIITEFCSV